MCYITYIILYYICSFSVYVSMCIYAYIYAVANYLYWYLKVEIGDATSGQMFQAVLTCFLMQLELGEDRVVPQSSNVGGAGGSSSASSSDASAINAGTEVTSGTTTTTTSMDTRHMLRELLAQDEYVATISK